MGIETLLWLVVYVVILGAVCWLLWWLIGFLALPEPFAKIARGIVAVVAVLCLVWLLLSLLPGTAPPLLKR